MRKPTFASTGTLLAAAGLAVAGMLVLPATQANAASCAQDAHAWIATPAGSIGGGSTISLADFTKVYPVGVALPGTKITYTLQDTGVPDRGNVFFLVNGQDTQSITSVNAASDNCVVNQPDPSQAPELVGTGPALVFGNFVDWKTNAPTNVLLGTVNMHG